MPLAAARLHRVASKVIDEKLNYIHINPVEEGLVFRSERYCHTMQSCGSRCKLQFWKYETKENGLEEKR
jgi:hypothetical protein